MGVFDYALVLGGLAVLLPVTGMVPSDELLAALGAASASAGGPVKLAGAVVLGCIGLFVGLMWCSPGFRSVYRPKLVRGAVEYRAAILVGFACPVSCVIRVINAIKNTKAEWFASPAAHDARVEAIQDQVLLWAESEPAGRKHMCSARGNWQNLSTRFVDKDSMHKIKLAQVSALFM